MGHRHSREEILDGALALALAGGLSGLTFGRVSKHLGVSDRIVVYYFPTKDRLVSDVLLAVGAELQSALGAALSSPASDHVALARSVWPQLTTPASERIVALFFEANGLAAAGRSPYAEIVPELVDAWIAWAAEKLEGRPAERRAEAAAAVALLDGLLLLRALAGPELATRATRRLGVTGPERAGSPWCS